MKKCSILIFVCFFVLLGCTFAPKDKYVSPIKPPPPTIKVSVDVQDPNFKDPYPLVVLTTFNFRIDSISNPILDYQVLLDGNAISNTTLNGTLLSFSLDPSKLNDASHPVKIQLKINSQSGSLANKLGLEYYLIEKDFAVIVDNALPTYTGTISLAMENGHLAIQWGKLLKTNFQIRIQHINYRYPLSGDTIISDPTITKFIDYGYVGGAISYTVSIFNNSSENQIGSANYYLKPLQFNVSNDKQLVEIISWDNVLIDPANLILKMHGNTLLDSWSGEGQLNLNFLSGDTLEMGNQDAISLSIQRKGFNTYRYDTIFYYTVQGNFTPFQSLKLTSNSKLFNFYGKITKLGFPDFVKEDSTDGSYIFFRASDDGQTGFFGYSYSQALVNLDNLSSFSQQQYFPDLGNVGNVSNNHLIGVNYFYPYGPSPGNIAGIYDLSGQKIIWSDTLNNDAPNLSEDGKYFVVNNSIGTEGHIYGINNGNWVFIGKAPIGTKFFRNNSTTELIVASSASISVYDILNGTDSNGNFVASRSFNIDPNSLVHTIGYDNVSQHIYVEYYGGTYSPQSLLSTIKVYDIENFGYVGSGKAVIYSNEEVHTYINGYHFLGSGFVQKIMK